MNTMKKYLILLLFALSFEGGAQHIQLNWNKIQSVTTIEERKAQLPTLSNQFAYLDENLIPHFYSQKNVNTFQQITLTNIQSKIVPKSALGEINFSSIPNEPTFIARTMKADKTLKQIIDLTSFYQSDGKLYQIQSFDIDLASKQSNPTYRTPPPESSVLADTNGTFYKLSISETGIYKIDYDFLSLNGISTDFNPSQFKVYGNGGMMLPENPGDFRYGGLQEDAIYAHGTEDGSFDNGDYFLFYAQGANGILRDGTENNGNPQHSKNLYEEVAYYFFNFESSGSGKRVSAPDISESSQETLGNFDQVLFYENDSVNIYNIGRQWLEPFGDRTQIDLSFEGSGTIASGELDYRLVGVNAANISAQMSVNGNNVASTNFNATGSGANFERRQGSGDFVSTYPLNVNVQIENGSNPFGAIYLDYIRLVLKQSLTFSGAPLNFRWFQDLTENSVYAFQINGNPEMVWDVSDRTNATILNAAANTYKFRAANSDFPNEFIAFNSTDALSPNFVSVVEPQALADLQNIDYVIVAYPDYVSQARQLADLHSEISGVSTAVVTTEQIYNEFSSGSQDVSGIRDFFKFLYEQSTPLKYALLLGDASYDYKDRISGNTNRVPSYESYNSYGYSATFVTDDFYTMVDDTDMGISSAQMDFAIGRLPAATATEAQYMIDKTIAYLNDLNSQGTPFGDWRSKVMLVVDDDDPGENQAFHLTIENNTATYLNQNQPQLTVRKLYMDAFEQEGTSGGFRYPSVTDAIVNGIETGTLLVNYFGHGGVNGWTQERVFTQDEVNSLSNYNSEFTRLPVFLTVTCDFTVWDIPEIESAGELLIKNSGGGSVAMITTSREILTSFGKSFNHLVVERMFEVENQKYVPLGEALRRAKQDNTSSEGKKVNLMGDPLLSLARPPRNITIDEINGEDAANFSGTIRALDFVSIKGTVRNIDNSAIDSDFNGTLTGTLFDKPVERTTLNNDGDLTVLDYEEQVDAVYRGKADVTNGEYTLEFYVPKDINYDLGNGKLLVYAENDEIDGINYKNDLPIGGINPEGVDDDEGPVVGLYMNNLNFADGGITDRNPYLLACVTDSTGINTTGVGIGHDIIELLDEDVNTTTVLNEYFEGGDTSPCINPDLRDFQKGRVFYRLRNLELGEHQVKFRIWDINNNSTTETLNFVVMDDGDQKLYINRLMNWPNPFTNQTYFHFEHNCPDVLEVQVQVFTVSGKLVKTIRQSVSSAPFREGYRTDKFGIPWDGLDDYGNKIGKGVYIYRTIVKGADSESCKGTATEVEKLVILK